MSSMQSGPGRALVQRVQQHATMSVLFRDWVGNTAVSYSTPTPTPAPITPQPAAPINPAGPAPTPQPWQRAAAAPSSPPPSSPPPPSPHPPAPMPHLSREEQVLRAISDLHRRKRADREAETQNLSWSEIRQRASQPQPRPGTPPAQRETDESTPRSLPDAPPPRRPRPTFMQREDVQRETGQHEETAVSDPNELTNPSTNPLANPSTPPPAAPPVQRSEATPATVSTSTPSPADQPAAAHPSPIQRQEASDSPAAPAAPSPVAEPTIKPTTAQRSPAAQTTPDPAPPSAFSDAAPPDSQPIQRSQTAPSPQPPAPKPTAQPPLEQVWAVERLAEPTAADPVQRQEDLTGFSQSAIANLSGLPQDTVATAPEPTKAAPAPSPSADSPAAPDPVQAQQLSHILRQVASEQPSDSSIELVLPRRPRPTAPPTMPPALPAPSQAARPLAATSQVARQADSGPTSSPESAPTSSPPAPSEPSPPAPALTLPPPQSDMIQTAIGPLPGDLWDLVGEERPQTAVSNPESSTTPPASSPPIQRTEAAPAPSIPVVQPTASVPQPIQRSETTPPAAPQPPVEQAGTGQRQADLTGLPQSAIANLSGLPGLTQETAVSAPPEPTQTSPSATPPSSPPIQRTEATPATSGPVTQPAAPAPQPIQRSEASPMPQPPLPQLPTAQAGAVQRQADLTGLPQSAIANLSGLPESSGLTQETAVSAPPEPTKASRDAAPSASPTPIQRSEAKPAPSGPVAQPAAPAPQPIQRSEATPPATPQPPIEQAGTGQRQADLTGFQNLSGLTRETAVSTPPEPTKTSRDAAPSASSPPIQRTEAAPTPVGPVAQPAAPAPQPIQRSEASPPVTPQPPIEQAGAVQRQADLTGFQNLSGLTRETAVSTPPEPTKTSRDTTPSPTPPASSGPIQRSEATPAPVSPVAQPIAPAPQPVQRSEASPSVTPQPPLPQSPTEQAGTVQRQADLTGWQSQIATKPSGLPKSSGLMRETAVLPPPPQPIAPAQFAPSTPARAMASPVLARQAAPAAQPDTLATAPFVSRAYQPATIQRLDMAELPGVDGDTAEQMAGLDEMAAEPDVPDTTTTPPVGLEQNAALPTPEPDAESVRAGVVSLYAEADELETAVSLLIRREGEAATFIAYVAESEIDDFLTRTEEEEEGALLVYATAEAAGTAVDDPIPLIVQQQGEEQKLVLYTAADALEQAIAQAEIAEDGPGIMVYGAEEDAAALGNPVELLLKQAGGADVLVTYADEAALAQLLETATLYEMTPVVDDLARQVYGRIRQRLLWERERLGH